MGVEDIKNNLLQSNVNIVTIYDIIESSLFEIYVFDSETLKFKYANPVALQNLKYSLAEISNLTPVEISPEYSEGSFRAMLKPLLPGKKNVLIYDTMHRRSDGTLYPVEVHLQMSMVNNQFALLAIIKDAIDNKPAEDLVRMRLELMDYAASHTLEEVLQKTLDQVESITGSSIGFYHFVDTDQVSLSLQSWSSRTIKEFCKAAGKGMHYPIDEAGVWVDCVFTKKPVIHNDYKSLAHRKGMPVGHAEVIRELIVPILRSGKVVAILGTGNKLVDYNESDVNIVTYFADMAWEIAERKRADEEIIRQLKEKETLLKEVHHRIKNNIASIESLLYLQSRSLASDEAKSALQDAYNRVKSMRLLYDKLLVEGDYNDISVKNYLSKLIDNIIDVFPENKKITVEKHLADFNLDVKRLFPLGIIINELITNTMKYAFTGRDSGDIQIALTKEGNKITLLIQDSGNGLPQDFNIDTQKGFGLMLVKMLSEQLKGSFTIVNQSGARNKLIFDL